MGIRAYINLAATSCSRFSRAPADPCERLLCLIHGRRRRRHSWGFGRAQVGERGPAGAQSLARRQTGAASRQHERVRVAAEPAEQRAARDQRGLAQRPGRVHPRPGGEALSAQRRARRLRHRAPPARGEQGPPGDPQHRLRRPAQPLGPHRRHRERKHRPDLPAPRDGNQCQVLLGAASQRIEYLAIELFGTEWMREVLAGWKRRERGCLPGLVESGVVIYVISIVVGEVRSLWSDGLLEYISDLWNIVDFIQNVFYVIWLCMRATSWFIVMREYWSGEDPWYPRDHWSDFEPMLLSEGAFGAAMIFSFLKLVHIFSVNPHLGPLQISLGRMIIDIIKFFFIYTLVLFAFGCGMNQLLWYYADLEKNKCYHLPSGLPDFDNNEKACSTWRRFANLFETSQSLFWASFGMVDLMSFDLTGIKSFTRFWALLMFGSYSVINIIVLLNMLIAMMSNSYQIISERADTEWKFARSHLWMSYFEDGDTVPPPFNMIPTAKTFDRIVKCGKTGKPTRSIIKKSRDKAQERHDTVMRLLIRRYVTTEQSKTDDFGITEDDVMEIRQDISTLRYELIDILRQNGMKTPEVDKGDSSLSGKKGRVMERRLQKDFQIGPIEGIVSSVISQGEKAPKDVFSQIAKAIGRKSSETKKKDWNAMVRQNTTARDPIGSSTDALEKQHRRSMRRHLQHQAHSVLESLDPQRLVEYNPALSEVSATTRIAYAKFMLRRPQRQEPEEEAGEGGGAGEKSKRESQRVKIAEPPKAGEAPDKPSAGPARALSTASRKSLSKAVSQERDKRPAAAASVKASLEAKPSAEARAAAPSPIPEEPEAGKDAVAPSTLKKLPSKDEKAAKPQPAPVASLAGPPMETTQARGRSKATGQIVGGWI
ncbi:transient receptor potential protein isoform X4 [Phymastichus coffea]|uniref:transient receptor potential protein isoform X4 n=1 Tax=Phymastichus coffea TaxID=108790 RepID=UPI00273BC92F|nr:transient receptor potential protein isoform X4 [Phymastichus coffea]